MSTEVYLYGCSAFLLCTFVQGTSAKKEARRRIFTAFPTVVVSFCRLSSKNVPHSYINICLQIYNFDCYSPTHIRKKPVLSSVLRKKTAVICTISPKMLYFCTKFGGSFQKSTRWQSFPEDITPQTSYSNRLYPFIMFLKIIIQ